MKTEVDKGRPDVKPSSEIEPKKEMRAVDVVDLYTTLEKLDVKIWIDGGWGVDALLGEQSRPHKDLDIAIQQKDVPKLRELLESRGYKLVREDNKWNFVFGHEDGCEVDWHAFVYDEEGQIVDGIMYPVDSLTGTGSIEGQSVRTISPEWMIKFHSGYELKDKDYQDVSALCKKYGIELPAEYAKFEK